MELPWMFKLVAVSGDGEAPAATTTAPNPIAAPTLNNAVAFKSLRTWCPPDPIARLRVGAIHARATGHHQVEAGVFHDRWRFVHHLRTRGAGTAIGSRPALACCSP